MNDLCQKLYLLSLGDNQEDIQIDNICQKLYQLSLEDNITINELCKDVAKLNINDTKNILSNILNYISILQYKLRCNKHCISTIPKWIS